MRWLILLAVLPLAYSQEGYVGHHLISYQATTKEDVEFLASLTDDPDFVDLDFWTDPSIIRPTDIRVRPEVLGKLRDAFAATGRTYNVLHTNMQEVVDQDKAEREMLKRNRAPGAGCNIAGEYCEWDEIEAMTDALADAFPERITKWTIGQSHENRTITAVRIAWDINHPHSCIWIEAGTHAREWISVATAVNLIHTLVYAETDDISQMLHKHDWCIVPVHNPDGYVYSFIENNRLWRKNRQPCGGLGQGTDLNRNWDINFGGEGSSGMCFSETYRGPAAFSAPETAALRDAVAASFHPWAFLSIHSYSQYMLVPYGYTHDKPDRYTSLEKVAQDMMDALMEVDGKFFEVGTPPDILYLASGGAFDYMYEVEGIRWSYTYELRPATAEEGGFVLPADQIPVSFEELLASLKSFVHADNES